jgi:hypothetical protein
MREAKQETGIRLRREQMIQISEQRREMVGGKMKYCPHFFIAHVTEEELDTRAEVTEEDGERMVTKVVGRNEVATMPDFLPQHIPFVRKAEKWF